MLLANVTVAEHVLTHFAACALLRRHAVPPPRQFEPLLRAAAAAGLSVDVSTSKVGFGKSLSPALDFQKPGARHGAFLCKQGGVARVLSDLIIVSQCAASRMSCGQP